MRQGANRIIEVIVVMYLVVSIIYVLLVYTI